MTRPPAALSIPRRFIVPGGDFLQSGGLFTRDFLGEGIKATPEWRSLSDAEVDALGNDLRALFDAFPHQRKPNETQTEDDFIWPVLRRLGWARALRQLNLSARGRESVPDGLLFASVDGKARANQSAADWERYRHGTAIVESKRWDRLLDRPDRLAEDMSVPSTQMLRYLRRVDDLTGGSLRWGMLTNGRTWRLYYQGARSVAEEFLEVDLGAVLGVAPYADLLSHAATPAETAAARRHWLRVFVLMFRREAFLLSTADQRSFLTRSLDEVRFWEEHVAENLSDLVFTRIFPQIAHAIATRDRSAPAGLPQDYLEEVRSGALVLLYRLLFVLYAEDRNLLPVDDPRYDDYALRVVREDVHRRTEAKDAFSSRVGNYYAHMRGLFRAIAEGDPALGLPPYNGGLFDPAAAPILDRVDLPDATIAPVVEALSRIDRDGRSRYINYRDLSVQQLGSIYERLLEHE